ncbi:MAG TPA: hypothetical protein VFB33_11480, partial [Candidatus Binataceae bacterium]|nr:hypothetical protein [Candidatus Binataceae bacterium]
MKETARPKRALMATDAMTTAAPAYDATRPGGDVSRGGGANQPAPPILRYAPGFVVLVAVLADAVQYADTDLWGHVRFGQMMLATHRVLRHDRFS